MTQTGHALRETIARELTGARQRTALLTDSVTRPTWSDSTRR
jgi:hypothetical protein